MRLRYQWHHWAIRVCCVSLLVCGLLYGSAGCFSAPNLSGFPCKEDRDCLESGSSCRSGVCVLAGGEVLEEPSDAGSPDDKPAEAGCSGEMCGGVCVDVQKSKSHCGKCDNKCPDRAICIKGKCVDEAYKKCEPSSSDCTAPFICARINPTDQSKGDFRCLKECVVDGDCDETQQCNQLTNTLPSLCFSRCENTSCKHIGKPGLFCRTSCTGSTCTKDKPDCGMPVTEKFSCVEIGGGDFQCAVHCTSDSQCSDGNTCQCPPDKPGCKDGETFCLK